MDIDYYTILESLHLHVAEHSTICVISQAHMLIILTANTLLQGVVGVVVQWLDYLAVMQEPGVRFPATAEKCHLMWRCPSGHGIN